MKNSLYQSLKIFEALFESLSNKISDTRTLSLSLSHTHTFSLFLYFSKDFYTHTHNALTHSRTLTHILTQPKSINLIGCKDAQNGFIYQKIKKVCFFISYIKIVKFQNILNVHYLPVILLVRKRNLWRPDFITQWILNAGVVAIKRESLYFFIHNSIKHNTS